MLLVAAVTIGATIVTSVFGDGMLPLTPVTVRLLAAFAAYGRSHLLPRRRTA